MLTDPWLAKNLKTSAFDFFDFRVLNQYHVFVLAKIAETVSSEKTERLIIP
jgi:hypothetical protein